MLNFLSVTWKTICEVKRGDSKLEKRTVFLRSSWPTYSRNSGGTPKGIKAGNGPRRVTLLQSVVKTSVVFHLGIYSRNIRSFEKEGKIKGGCRGRRQAGIGFRPRSQSQIIKATQSLLQESDWAGEQ